MEKPLPRTPLEEDVCIHIFTVSAAMVGVCLTVIGLTRVIITVRKADTLADDFLAVDAVLFLVSCLSRRMHRVERFADLVFVFALVLMVFICMFITYAITHI